MNEDKLFELIDTFVHKYENKFVEAGGSNNAKNQCVDLVNLYLEQVFNYPKILNTNALDFPKKIDSNTFEWINNTANNYPKKGDVVVWGKPWGKYYSNGKIIYAGHIAINLDGNSKTFLSFDQNYPVGKPCEKVVHNYSGVLGWFTYKKKEQIMSDKKYTEAEMSKIREERDKNWNLYQNEKTSHEKRIDEFADFKVIYEAELKVKENQISGYKGQITKKESEISDLMKQLEKKNETKPFLQGKRKMFVSVLTPIVAIISQLLAKNFNIDLPPETILYLVLTGLAYIGVEGVKDLTEVMRSKPESNG